MFLALLDEKINNNLSAYSNSSGLEGNECLSSGHCLQSLDNQIMTGDFDRRSFYSSSDEDV